MKRRKNKPRKTGQRQQQLQRKMKELYERMSAVEEQLEPVARPKLVLDKPKTR